jgi:hypothetical protein
MTSDIVWEPLRAELARRAEAKGNVCLWLRDDDAVTPAAALQTLVDLVGDFAVPIAVAAIPAHSSPALARFLQNASHATPVVHGWRHDNHAPATQKKQELGDHRPLDAVLSDLSVSLIRMTELFGDRLVPMLVPPWNRISASILPHLRELGYRALSCHGAERADAPVPVFNTHIDLIDWRASRRSRDHASLVRDVVRHIRRAAPAGGPVGILTHHLVHDEEAWTFLRDLFKVTRGFDCCRWLSAADLISGDKANSQN